MDAVLIDELRLFEADDGGGRGCWVEPGPGWPFWCLSHNLEIAAALAAVRNLSWVRGWDSHKTLGEFCEALKANSEK